MTGKTTKESDAVIEPYVSTDKDDLIRAVRKAKLKDLNRAAEMLGKQYDLKRILGRPVKTVFDYLKCAGTLFDEDNRNESAVKAELIRGINSGDTWYVGLALALIEGL